MGPYCSGMISIPHQLATCFSLTLPDKAGLSIVEGGVKVFRWTNSTVTLTQLTVASNMCLQGVVLNMVAPYAKIQPITNIAYSLQSVVIANNSGQDFLAGLYMVLVRCSTLEDIALLMSGVTVTNSPGQHPQLCVPSSSSTILVVCC